MKDINKIFKIPTLFIVYAHDKDKEKEQRETLLSLVDYLRRNAVFATCDFIESSRHPSIHIPRMEMTALNYDKVIIVLSELYKTKAEDGLGGVGEEYSQISAEINSPKYKDKYIIGYINAERGPIPFDTIEKICPKWMSGREIIDLYDADELVRIVHGTKKYELAQVSDVVPVMQLIAPEDYKTLAERAKKQKNRFGFENMSILTTTTFFQKIT